MTFKDLHLTESLLAGLDAMNIHEPTPIQEMAIPLILDNKDLIACAQTGTGKTAAFLLPIIHKIITNPTETTNTLVVVPTRELAIQIDQVMQGLSYFTNVASIAIYGGTDGVTYAQEQRALARQTPIIIATPGRLISHLTMKDNLLEHVEHLVLDEADRMLDMGFYDDIIKIDRQLVNKKQTLMFSATMPPKIRILTKKLLNHPEEINLAVSKPAAGVLQIAYNTYDKQKTPMLQSLLSGKNLNSILVFASTKIKVKDLARDLIKLKLNVKAIHSDLEQDERREVMNAFASKQLQILVATDIVSRGIDIEDIDLVVNYDVPSDAEDYVHRIGRTARAKSSGLAITFISESDQQRFSQIENLIGEEIRKPDLPEELGEGPVYDPSKNKGFRNSFKGGGKRNFSRKPGENNHHKRKPNQKSRGPKP